MHYHVPVAPEEIPTIASTAQFGRNRYLCMFYDFQETAQNFHGFMDHVLRAIDFTFVYID